MVIDFSTFYDLPRQMEMLMENLGGPTFNARRMSYPPVNISEDENGIYVSSEIPGMDMEDIELTLTEGSLLIKGNRKPVTGSYYRQERPTGNFQRVINLNIPIDPEKTTAKMKNGVLDIFLPKAQESQPKKINIEIA